MLNVGRKIDKGLCLWTPFFGAFSFSWYKWCERESMSLLTIWWRFTKHRMQTFQSTTNGSNDKTNSEKMSDVRVWNVIEWTIRENNITTIFVVTYCANHYEKYTLRRGKKESISFILQHPIRMTAGSKHNKCGKRTEWNSKKSNTRSTFVLL